MTTDLVGLSSPPFEALNDASATASAEERAPIRPLGGRPDWRPWFGAALSMALLAGVLFQLGSVQQSAIAGILRFRPDFWATFWLLYLAQPLSELIIFRRLWGLPLSGLGVLLRKGVINEIVFGYSGEVYFYAWARRRAGLANAPFGAIKDVNILSALAGNVVTLGMLAVSVAALKRVDLARYLGPTLWSGVAVVGLSLAILLFARRVFSLRPKDLAFVSGVHAGRLAATTLLTALLWHIALPGVAVGVWIVLVTLRLLVSRLPFLTNKDLVFANLAFVLVGTHGQVSLLLATLSVTTLVAHLGVLGLLTGGDVLRATRKR